ncbi:MAG: UDP-N-acetylmuramoyl-tripeptide--D-alanyl-D-alanine ligase [Firmicutes bacterium]|nr:UDP-N-acetylmuramoyl-tripeptide--D-alanyl-D-alanine ligase [Bacillota bacterium]
MKPIPIAQLIKWTCGQYIEGPISTRITGVSIDSRTLRPGDLFVPLRGERFDGHDFLKEALDRGAVAVLIEESRVNELSMILDGLDGASFQRPSPGIIAVSDTLLALQRIARAYRSLCDRPVIAVTGSTGKTTTKDMTASIVRQLGPVLKTQENYNNEIGLPLTLLQLETWHKTVVVEMGMRGLGQIRALTQIAQPNVGVVTNVGTVHLELLGSQRAIQRAKQELVATMAPGSVVVLNADDALVKDMAAIASDKRIIYYGWQTDLAEQREMTDVEYVTASQVVTHGAKGVSFQLCYDGKSIEIELPVPGEYQVSNALGAAAAALAVGADFVDVQAGLAELSLSSMRMELIPWAGGGVVINDAYNANPTSMASALATAHEIAAGRPLVLVLGDMLELGHISEAAHKDIGRQAADVEPACLIAVGTAARGFGEGAREAGMPDEKIVECATHEDAQETALQVARPGDVVLVKGSRGIALENVVQALCAGSKR